MTSPRLRVEGVTRRFGDREVLRGVDLAIGEGKAVALVGPSGSGKSTLLNIIGSLDCPDSGTVLLNEIAVHELKGQALATYRATQVGFVFQEHHLLPQLPAIENVLLPTLVSGGNEATAVRLLADLGLAGKEHQFPATLSGGERQRVALARALMSAPPLVLGDEPTGSLDRETGIAIVELLIRQIRDRAASLLVVTHNLEQAALFDRVYRLVGGHLEPV